MCLKSAFKRQLLAAVFAPETVHPAFGVDYLLLSGVERVALRTDIYVEPFLLAGAFRFENMATVACHCDFRAFWVCIFFHPKGCPSLFATFNLRNRRHILWQKPGWGQVSPDSSLFQGQGCSRGEALVGRWVCRAGMKYPDYFCLGEVVAQHRLGKGANPHQVLRL